LALSRTIYFRFFDPFRLLFEIFSLFAESAFLFFPFKTAAVILTVNQLE